MLLGLDLWFTFGLEFGWVFSWLLLDNPSGKQENKKTFYRNQKDVGL